MLIYASGRTLCLVGFRDFLKPISCLLPEFNELSCRLEGFIYLENILSFNEFPAKIEVYLRGN